VLSPICKSVSAYVEVWSSNRTENYSKTFAQQLLDMGAKVSKTFNKQVTHVVFKEGRLATWRKAQKTGVKLVSVLWVEKCREAGAHVDESLFPAIYTNEGLPLLIKKHKCMQPKDFVEKTPENDKRLQKKIDLMAKELDIQKTATETDIPVLLFEDDGSLAYSPTDKIKDQCSAMEKRIKEMKEKRENLSPTGSSHKIKPFHFFPSRTITRHLINNCSRIINHSSSLAEEHISDSLNSSFGDLWGNCKYKNQKPKPTRNDIYVSTAVLEHPLFSSSDQGDLTPKSTNRKHLNKLSMQRSLESKKRKSKESPNLNQTVTMSNQSDSLMSSADSINMHAVDINIPVDREDCSVRYKIQGKTERKSIKLTTSALCKVGSENEFLLAMTTRNKSSEIEEASYEDFFSPSNLNKSKKQIKDFPLQVQQKLPSTPEISCKRGFLSHKRERLFEGSDKQCVALFKKRRTGGVNAESAEALGSSTLNQFQQSLQNISCRTSVNSCPQTIDYHIERELCISETRLPEKNAALMASDSISLLKNDYGDVQPFEGLLETEFKGALVLKSFERLCTNSKQLEHAQQGQAGIASSLHSVWPISVEPVWSRYNLSNSYMHGIENEISVCETIDASGEVFNKNKNKPSRESKKTGRVKKPTRTLVMTSMSSEKQCAMIQVVNKLGGFLFSDDVCETTTHVVTGSPRRTLNVILGIARGCWIVSYEWVLWSLECGHWISEEPYELSTNFPAAPLCSITCY
uniref:Microcephalin n=1 Tax=Pelodiscus sinensis TaxID=13735 RepID=K7GFJ1_PELSI